MDRRRARAVATGADALIVPITGPPARWRPSRSVATPIVERLAPDRGLDDGGIRSDRMCETIALGARVTLIAAFLYGLVPGEAGSRA